MIDLGLKGKRAIVVGAGRGIGRESALNLGRAGAHVACLDFDAARASAVANEIGRLGVKAVSIAADARQRGQVDAAVATAVAAFGGLDVAVDVVGGSRWNEFERLTDEEWEDSFAMCLNHVYYLYQAAARQMIAQGAGGSLVAISSLAGVTSSPRSAAYGAAKAGLNALTRSVAVELGPKGIRANAVAPGATMTDRQLLRLGLERYEDLPMEQMKEIVKPIPLKRFGRQEEIAKAVLFFASDLSSYVTGQVLLVDGGVSADFPFEGPPSGTRMI